MKYLISQIGSPKTSFDEYFSYISNLQEVLPKHIYDFASSYRNYELNSSHTLHDAWLNQVKIQEASKGERGQQRSLNITIELLNAYHDKIITLQYKNVYEYDFSSVTSPDKKVAHGDLLIHEFSYEKPYIIHYIAFSNGNKFRIAFEDMGLVYTDIN